MTSRNIIVGIIAGTVGLTAVGCEGEIGPPGGEEMPAAVQPALLAPPRPGFEVVANALQPHCGTLDCHGQIGRNWRLYGGRGLRLDPKANPADGTTTPDEFDATYWSTVALEPETLTLVVRDKGAHPERLSMIRKGRGTERHKGGTQMVVGDDLDRCLTAWLADAIIEAPCRSAAKFGTPLPPMETN